MKSNFCACSLVVRCRVVARSESIYGKDWWFCVFFLDVFLTGVHWYIVEEWGKSWASGSSLWNQWGMSMPRFMKRVSFGSRHFIEDGNTCEHTFRSVDKKIYDSFVDRSCHAWGFLIREFCLKWEGSESIHFWLQRSRCLIPTLINDSVCLWTRSTLLPISRSDGKPISRLSDCKGSIFYLALWGRFWMWRVKRFA